MAPATRARSNDLENAMGRRFGFLDGEIRLIALAARGLTPLSGCAMRTTEDFNQLYNDRDAWGIAHASFRDRALARAIGPHVAGKRVLELSCGEGHLTSTLFGPAASVLGIDISDVAIARAKARGIRNARFKVSDLLAIPFAGYDVIAAIECIYYLDAEERQVFFAKVDQEHRGTFVMTTPIIGGKYWTHDELMRALAPIGDVRWRNIYPRQTGVARMVDLAIRATGMPVLLDFLPEAAVYQRAYVVQ
jgi:SAM-dependent methyltransferase